MAALHVAFALAIFTGNAIGVNNGLARTPQMGWVSDASDSVLAPTHLTLPEQLEFTWVRRL
jgi:alpha-galactosidase